MSTEEKLVELLENIIAASLGHYADVDHKAATARAIRQADTWLEEHGYRDEWNEYCKNNHPKEY